MLAGLTGAGALLAGSLLMLLRRRRAAQFRHRRPGHTLAAPDAVLAPVEKTITAVGAATAPTVEHLDAVLRRLAAARPATTTHARAGRRRAQRHRPGPAPGLPSPATRHPWTGTDDGHHWTLATEAPLDEIGPVSLDQPAPYPLLVTIGVSDDRRHRGCSTSRTSPSPSPATPPTALDLARYLAAEIACNPWSTGVTHRLRRRR